MKILLFTDTFYDANGVSRFLQDIAIRAYERGDDFTFVTSTAKQFGNKNLPNVINVKPIFRMRMPFYRDLDLAVPPIKKLSQIFHEKNPDIVHVSTPGFVGLVGRYLAKKYKKPIAGVYHTNFPAYMKKNIPFSFAYNTTLQFMRYFYKPFDLVFSRSTEYMEHLEKELHLNPTKFERLSAGIDIKTFNPHNKDKKTLNQILGVGSADIKVLYVGRLTKEKNFPFLITVWKEFHQKMQEKGEKVVLICVGEGKYFDQKELLKLHDIFFVGRKTKEELPYMYIAADFFVFPSTTDTLGQVVMEALACKTAVIVSDKGGPMGIIQRAKQTCGFALPVQVNKWVEAMCELSFDEKKREQMAQSGYEMMQTRSIEKSFESYLKAHKKLLK